MLKKVVVILFILLMAFSLPGCLENNEEPEEEVATEIEEDKEEISEKDTPEEKSYYVSVSIGSSFFMRDSPGSEDQLGDDVIDELQRGEKVTVKDKHDDSEEKDGYTWWEIEVPSSEKEGWVASDFLSQEEVKAVEYDPEAPFSMDEFGFEDEGLESGMDIEEVTGIMGAPEK